MMKMSRSVQQLEPRPLLFEVAASQAADTAFAIKELAPTTIRPRAVTVKRQVLFYASLATG
jgi:hypothetical protein